MKVTTTQEISFLGNHLNHVPSLKIPTPLTTLTLTWSSSCISDSSFSYFLKPNDESSSLSGTKDNKQQRSLLSHFLWSWRGDCYRYNSLNPSEMNEMGTWKRKILSPSKDGEEGQRKLPNRGDTILGLDEEQHVNSCKWLGRWWYSKNKGMKSLDCLGVVSSLE